MLGRKTYTQEELDRATAAVQTQLKAYRKLAKAVKATGDPAATKALEELEPILFNNMTLVLDRHFVHRLRVVTGKDGNPLNEVELLTASLLDGGTLQTNTVIKYKPDESVLKLEPGAKIALSETDFDKLAKAFLNDLAAKFT